MENISEQEIKKLFDIHENNFCFECGGVSNEWVSMNNGIFLCATCAGIHKGFEIEISHVRSLTVNTWSKGEFEMMKKGGNDKLLEFFECYGVSMTGHMDVKYRTKAAFYYREKLKALAEGLPIPESILPEEGPEVINEGEVEPEYDELGFVTTSAHTEIQETDDSSLAKKENKFAKSLQSGFKSFGNSIASGAKSVASGTKSAATKLNEKMKNTHLKENTKSLGNKIASGTKGAAGKIAVASKKGYSGAVGFFKGLKFKKKDKEIEEIVIDEFPQQYESSSVSNKIQYVQDQYDPRYYEEDNRPSASL